MFNEDGEFVWYDDNGNQGFMKLLPSDPSVVAINVRDGELKEPTTTIALHQISNAKTLRALAGAAIHFAQRIDPLPDTRPEPVSGPDRLT